MAAITGAHRGRLSPRVREGSSAVIRRRNGPAPGKGGAAQRELENSITCPKYILTILPAQDGVSPIDEIVAELVPRFARTSIRYWLNMAGHAETSDERNFALTQASGIRRALCHQERLASDATARVA